jgi:hypothetical protein
MEAHCALAPLSSSSSTLLTRGYQHRTSKETTKDCSGARHSFRGPATLIWTRAECSASRSTGTHWSRLSNLQAMPRAACRSVAGSEEGAFSAQDSPPFTAKLHSVTEVEGKASSRTAAHNVQPLRVAVICGGPSAERGISLNSARSVLDHLQV